MATQAHSEVRTDTVLPISADEANRRLCTLLHAAPDHADGPITVRLLVGPTRGVHFPAKAVRGTLAGPQQRGSTHVFQLHWEPTGLAAAAYPTLDANLGITTIDEHSSLLSIVADYAPPFGAIGAAADRAALCRVADATVTAVLLRLAHAITHARPHAVGV